MWKAERALVGVNRVGDSLMGAEQPKPEQIHQKGYRGNNFSPKGLALLEADIASFDITRTQKHCLRKAVKLNGSAH